MYSNNEIVNELNELSSALIPLQRLNVFTVPTGYFDQLSDSIFSEINEADHFLPAEAINMMDVPEGYFDTLADHILAKVKGIQPVAEELKELSPTFSVTGNDNVFSVPNRYFEDLPGIILSRVKTPARVISLNRRASFSRYASAAIITGLLGLSLFSVFNKKTTISNDTSTLTASLVKDAKNIMQTGSFEQVLQTVSDEEIVGYLENNGQDVNAALVASATDSKELPGEDEYITNDNTLNNFLDQLNINDYSN